MVTQILSKPYWNGGAFESDRYREPFDFPGAKQLGRFLPRAFLFMIVGSAGNVIRTREC